MISVDRNRKNAQALGKYITRTISDRAAVQPRFQNDYITMINVSKATRSTCTYNVSVQFAQNTVPRSCILLFIISDILDSSTLLEYHYNNIHIWYTDEIHLSLRRRCIFHKNEIGKLNFERYVACLQKKKTVSGYAPP